ncbi:uncharacterized protein F5891DRAFT_1216029 [Suillus fuscotomentosus]|uniref:Uncharacterized protein n=1 Tax=Suillus fuscotomentosus TaxID=1912939 RepID=A0AAD4DPW0_9AGAM|nr:uncharacterized protein F5891DRAFT_1216029 [Suillus fuscotomentosus]KAG1888983.1 hypothetical protein F5891DRAFT_1216029 [Suillus fuscotomentosus]
MVDKPQWRKHHAAGLNAWWASKRQRTSSDTAKNDENGHVADDVCSASSKASNGAALSIVSKPFSQVPFLGAKNTYYSIQSPLPKPHLYKVTCEDTEDEEDLIGIRGVRWKEMDQTEFLLEEIFDELLTDTSHQTDSANHDDVVSDVGLGDNKTDAESDLRKPPTVEEARKALNELRTLLKPPRHDQTGYHDPKLPPILQERLNHMKNFLWLYTDVGSDGRAHPANFVGGHWGKAADRAACNAQAGKRGQLYLSRCLRSWLKAYIKDRNALPHRAPRHSESRINDESFAADLKLHLQKRNLPQNGTAMDRAARLSMEDGTKGWTDKNISTAVQDLTESSSSTGRRVVHWFHDESMFYAHDRRKQRWVHINESAVPLPKGEGASLMVADFVSAVYGWLHSADGKESGRILFRAGKARDGYFTNNNIIAHAEKAMDILSRDYPNEDHVLIFDNATTHRKRADDALSARKMPKNPSKSWGVTLAVKDVNGKPLVGADGKPVKQCIRMADTCFANGDTQSLYFPEGHEKAGWFKGMVQLLVERGYADAPKLRAECKDFKCLGDRTDCCCRRLMYSQPGFTVVESRLESSCRATPSWWMDISLWAIALKLVYIH